MIKIYIFKCFYNRYPTIIYTVTGWEGETERNNRANLVQFMVRPKKVPKHFKVTITACSEFKEFNVSPKEEHINGVEHSFCGSRLWRYFC